MKKTLPISNNIKIAPLIPKEEQEFLILLAQMIGNVITKGPAKKEKQ